MVLKKCIIICIIYQIYQYYICVVYYILFIENPFGEEGNKIIEEMKKKLENIVTISY